MTSDGGPPWMAHHPDGSIHLGGVPERLLRHPGLKDRGIELVGSLKPGLVFRTHREDSRNMVVKVLDLHTEELPIYERLLRHLYDPANHTVPCEIDRTNHPLLIMPMLSHFSAIITHELKSQTQLLDVLYQLVEGVDYLHRQHIVHMDLCPGNILVSSIWFNNTVPRNRLFIVDFDTSRQFELGPGIQPAIELPETQTKPPNGLSHFDPYSWDVFCLGRAFERLLKIYIERTKSVPQIARWYTKWLIGEERGCHTVCHCRPSARTARLVMAFIRFLGPLIDFYDTMSLKLFGEPSTGP